MRRKKSICKINNKLLKIKGGFNINSSPSHKKIILDFDNVLVNTAKAMFDYYQWKTNDYSLKYNESLVTWNMGKLIPWDKKEVNSIFKDKDFFNFLNPYPGTIESLNKLKEMGHTLEICTLHSVITMEHKLCYIKNTFPMVDIITILPLENNKFDKSKISGDIIVDDRVDILDTSICDHKILFGSYDWNKHNKKYARINSLEQLIKIVKYN